MNPTPLYIVTGSSRGMGAAIAARLLRADATLIGIARRTSEALTERAAANRARLEQWTLDLTDGAAAARRLQDWLAARPATAFTSATLINNAALLARVGPVDEADDAELAASLRIGLEAPLLLSAAFLRATRDWPGPRRILNISSGLGRRAMAGSAPYCAVKAGLDNLSAAMALDEARRPNGARIVALAPGVIDTDMQGQLRSAAAEGFPDRASFVQMKDRGQLATPDDAAARVLEFLARPEFGQTPLAQVRTAA
ncbi:MAG: SDR family NAD(P)-dependent oxidoreductase [Burkholderiaceae bacterium]